MEVYPVKETLDWFLGEYKKFAGKCLE